MIKKANYSTFLLFKSNVETLNGLRPDFYFSPGINGYQIMGEVTKSDNFSDIFEDQYKTVRAINTSIVLNTTSFFEGFLENILLRKIGSTENLHSPVEKIVNTYQSQIIRISSIDEFKRHFQKLFGVKLINVLESHKDDVKFIEKFYLIRHLLSHASMVETDLVDHDPGIQLVHSDTEYTNLMEYLQSRYRFQEKIDVEFMSLLICSKIIDDFSMTVFNIADLLVNELKS